MPKKLRLYVKGMHGLGDSIHQRALFRKLLPKYDIWLEASWPSVYHDMPEIKFIDSGKELRTQKKNRERQKDRFVKVIPAMSRHIKIHYRGDQIRQYGSVLAAMMRNSGVNPMGADFSLPIPKDWLDRADSLIASFKTEKPILFYRPLVKRTEWGGCDNRNPDGASYKELFDFIRKDFFVVSVADLVDDVEWMVSPPVDSDIEFHKGELDFELMAALVSRCSLVYASPGFAIPLAKSVSTPAICIFGGYENSKSFEFGNSPYLGIDTINPCMCFSHEHNCEKRIDIPLAKEKIRRFLNANPPKSSNKA